MSSIVNKVKDVLHKDEGKPTIIEPKHSGTHAEPRTTGTTHGAGTGAGTNPSSHDGAYTTSHNYDLGGDNWGTDGPASKTDGPHKSNLMNKLDPRVDSDRDGSRNLGAAHPGVHTGAGPTGTTTGTTTRDDPAYTGHGHGTTGTAVGTGATAAGHHDAGHGTLGTTEANTRDPRVHSDRDTKGAPEGTYGPHGSRVANAADPRVDSDRDNSRTVGGAHSGTHTTGPHQSDLANKLDPRVDSDRDGSQRVGGDKTETRASRSLAERDSSGAAQALPSMHSDDVHSRVPPEQHCGL